MGRGDRVGDADGHGTAAHAPMNPAPLIAAGALAGLLVYRRKHVSTPLLGVAVLAFAGLVAYGTGLVHPPSIELVVRHAVEALGTYTYALVGGLAFAETAGFAGLVAPGELGILLGGVSAGHGETNLLVMIGLVWVCSVAGDLTSYAIGRRLGRAFMIRHGAVFGVTEERLSQVERHFDAHGGKTILIGRSIGVVRSLAPFIAGASRMPLRRFVPYTTIAAGVWGALLCVLGYLFWGSLDELVKLISRGSIGLAVTAAIVAGAIVLYRQRRPAAQR
jgi:membrane protein DedA with SNARE-associated domain